MSRERRNVQREAKCPGGGGHISRGRNVRGVKCPGDEMSTGKMS